MDSDFEEGTDSDFDDGTQEQQNIKDQLIDIASFKAIVDIQKKEMHMLLEEKSKTTNDDHKTLTAKWTTFFSAAKKQSRKK